jgi:hypothetical protein
MTVSNNPFTAASFPFEELEAIRNAIAVMEHALPMLRAGEERLSCNLDELTSPTALHSRPELANLSFEYRGKVRQCRSLIDVYVEILRFLWTDFPDRREVMASAIAKLGRSRTYVSKAREELYFAKASGFVHKHSCLLVEGWFVDTNLSAERISKILPVATAAAGLHWTEDVRARW